MNGFSMSKTDFVKLSKRCLIRRILVNRWLLWGGSSFLVRRGEGRGGWWGGGKRGGGGSNYPRNSAMPSQDLITCSKYGTFVSLK